MDRGHRAVIREARSVSNPAPGGLDRSADLAHWPASCHSDAPGADRAARHQLIKAQHNNRLATAGQAGMPQTWRRLLADCTSSHERHRDGPTRIACRLPQARRFIAYPYGLYNRASITAARDVGMEAGFTMRGRAVTPGFPLLAWPRIGLAGTHAVRSLRAAEPIHDTDCALVQRSLPDLSSVCGILTRGQSWRPVLLRTASASMMRNSPSRVIGNRPVKRKPRLCSGLSISK